MTPSPDAYVEDYDFVIENRTDLSATGRARVEDTLGYPRSAQHYFAGFALYKDTGSIWRYSTNAASAAYEWGVFPVFIWAYTQVMRDGYVPRIRTAPALTMGDIKEVNLKAPAAANDVLTYQPDARIWKPGKPWMSDLPNPANNTFLNLVDVPDSYMGHGQQFARIKADGSGLEFVPVNQVPAGGAAGQVLQKFSPTDGATTWSDLTAGITKFTATGGLSSTNVQSALAELDTEKQPINDRLTAFSGLSSGVNALPFFTAATTMAVTTLSAYGRNLIDDADAPTARTTLGLGTAATQNTGTSGMAIPLLDGANTWNNTQVFSAIRTTHANQVDGNDGVIAAGNFSEGLNIVGVQTVAGSGRKIGYYGTLVQAGLGSVPNSLGATSFTGAVTVPDETYVAASWDGSTQVPTKNAVRDKIEALAASKQDALSTPATQIPALSAPWINYGGGFLGARYFKTAEGLVVLEGLIQAPGGSATNGVTLFTLLPGYRPSGTLIFTTWNGGGAGRVDIDAAGNVVMQAGNTVFTSLSGITFVAA